MSSTEMVESSATHGQIVVFLEGTEAMSKHTPGPWRAARIRSPGRAAAAYYIYGAGKDQRSPCVAHVKNSTIQPLHANARLIAAAPDLLAALHAVVNLPGFEPDEPYGVQVLAAIAKAEGRKP